MTNAVSFPQTSGVGSDLQAALGQSQVQEKQVGGTQYLWFGSQSEGEWAWGKDRNDCSNAILTVNTKAIRHGWHHWLDKELSEYMVPFTAALPDEPAPERVKGKLIQASEARELQGMMQDDDGEFFPVTFATSSYGGCSGVDGLLADIKSRATTEAEFLYPLVELTHADPYENKHKAGEMIYNPVFKIVGWVNEKGDAAEDNPAIEDASDEIEDAPVRKRKR